jgi:hypothetical protein
MIRRASCLLFISALLVGCALPGARTGDDPSLLRALPRTDAVSLIHPRRDAPPSLTTGPAAPAMPAAYLADTGERRIGAPMTRAAMPHDAAITDGRGDGPLTLRFATGSHTPDTNEKIDLALSAAVPALRAEGRDRVHAFLLTARPLATHEEEALQGLGVRLLGAHGDSYKVAIPLDAIEAMAALPFTGWIGFSGPDLKLSRELQALLREAASTDSGGIPEQMPLIINLFDQDRQGHFARALRAHGVTTGMFDADLTAYRAAAPWQTIRAIAALDFVLFIEPILELPPAAGPAPAIGAQGSGGAISQMQGGSSVVLGIMDTGFMAGRRSPAMHADLDKWGCGRNFTTDLAGVWHDEHWHGTHVLATAAGTGTHDSRFGGAFPDLGGSVVNPLRAAKIWRADNFGPMSWTEDAMAWMAEDETCGGFTAPRPHLINLSGGGYWGGPLAGTDSTSRKLDAMVWRHRQLYVTAAGNAGPGETTALSPAVAKNALAVGMTRQPTRRGPGEIVRRSSRGPTADGRMKPNLVAPGDNIRAADARNTNGYRSAIGTSMATPQVSGAAARLMHHYPELKWRPMALRALLMATAQPHGNDTSRRLRNSYGFGHLNAGDDMDSAAHSVAWAQLDAGHYAYHDITVPHGARRLSVVMTWDEPPASAGAATARLWDLELWADHGAACPLEKPRCGTHADRSARDTVLSVIIDNPPPGVWRLKAVPRHAPRDAADDLPTAIAAVVAR